MALYDLCALGDVKAWLGRTDTNSDAVLSSLITRASRQLYSYLQRGLILPRGVTETRDGTGGDAIVLRQWPVISIAALQIGGQTIAQAPSGCGAGWTLEAWDGTPPGGPQRLTVTGYSFGLAFPGANNTQNIEIAYRAGYQVSVEPNLVANSSAIVLAPYGGWASDAGVVYAQTGVAFVAVTGAPGPGQYQLTPGQPGSYTFNAGDDGAAILISYGFIPSDLAQACIELVSEMYKYSQRIGETTHSLGGNETVGFDNTRFTPLVAALLQPYRNLLPI